MSANIIPIFNMDGSEAGNFEVDANCFELTKGTQAVHDDVVAFMAGQRAGTASTKTRTEVSGGGAKPFRQKGTGRARAGSSRSPIWRGGGISFGPKPRDFSKRINKKVRKLALKRAFSERVSEGAVMLLDELTLEQPKTQAMVALLKTINAGDDVLVVAGDLSGNVLLAARNLPGIEIMEPRAINAYWMLLFKKVVFTRTGMDVFLARFAKEEQA